MGMSNPAASSSCLLTTKQTVARAGQDGYHHRTSVNHKVYRIGKAENLGNASTEFDITKKTIVRPSLPPLSQVKANNPTDPPRRLPPLR